MLKLEGPSFIGLMANTIIKFNGGKKMEGYRCIYTEHRACDSCGYCKKVEPYEPSDAEIEAEIERQLAEAEAMADNL